MNTTSNNPTKVRTNGAYGTDWTAVATAMTEGGVDVTSDLTYHCSRSGKRYRCLRPIKASLEDSTVAICVTVTDNNTGCDSTFCRWVYVPATPQVADWTAGQDGCDGDVVAFANKTTHSQKVQLNTLGISVIQTQELKTTCQPSLIQFTNSALMVTTQLL